MAHASEATGPSVIDLVVDTLAENGPMTEEELTDLVVATGTDLGPYPDDEVSHALLESEGLAQQLNDDRWVWLPALLAGRVFTRRLTAVEVEHHLLKLDVDLAPLAALTEETRYQLLADGTSVSSAHELFDSAQLRRRRVPLGVVGEESALLLPPGYLATRGMVEGTVIALRVEPDGLTLNTAEHGEPTVHQLTSLRDRMHRAIELDQGEPSPLDEAIWSACAADPSLFSSPLPPLGEILAGCELTAGEGWVAPSGFDLLAWSVSNQTTALSGRHGLDADETSALRRVIEMHRQLVTLVEASAAIEDESGELDDQPEPPAISPEDSTVPATLLAALPLLAKPSFAEAALFETIGSGRTGAAALGLFAENYEPMAPRSARPALRWLRGRALERLGNIRGAEAAYLEAESMDPAWPPLLIELARYASDRGDAARAVRLLRRVGVPDEDGVIQMLRRMQPEPRSDLGRNQPCWCGSGRKYKQCHLRNEVTSLDKRAAWLYQKAEAFIDDGPWREALMEVALERASFDDAPTALLTALDDQLTIDAVLFEGGGFEDFLATRGELLPEDERLLAEQWLLVERSLYEIQEVRAGEGFTARDVRTGDVVEVQERSATRQLQAGHLICARVVPAGDTLQIFGGVEPVSMGQREELIELLDSEPDPVELVEFLTRRFAPPVVINSEREPILVCEATLRTTDVAALTLGLDKSYQRADEDDKQLRWHELVDADGMSNIRAMLSLQGDRLTVSTNSEARMDRVLAHVQELVPSITIVEQSRESPHDVRKVAGGAPAAKPLDPTDPAVAEIMEQFIRDYEHKWLDESIPALTGYTPRQAANDPTRRDDLIRLLSSFPRDPDNPAMMSPERLSEALGLD